MLYPRIIFRASAKQDFETARGFIKDAEYDNGRNLQWAVFKTYPRLKAYFGKNKRYSINDKAALRNFINSTYCNKRAGMHRALEQHKKRWVKIAPICFLLIDELFKGRKWPQGKYIAFGTIWSMYPRFLKEKTFQIPFWHRTPRYVSVVIAHELLHFMFYDYFYARFPKYRRANNNFFVWHVSEIFNTVVQNSPKWVHCFKLKSLGYPEHKNIVASISRTWRQRSVWPLDMLVDKIVQAVQDQKLVQKIITG